MPIERRRPSPLTLSLCAGLLWPLVALLPPLDPLAARKCHAAEGKPADRDGDGVPDDLDRCPDKPGPAANLGCPDRDEDGDGIVDRLDYCPDVPGPAANHGCPDGMTPKTEAEQAQEGPHGAQAAPAPGGELAQLRTNHFEWPEPIPFEPGTDKLTERGLSEVEATARILLSHPELRHLLIEGHVDEPGNTAARARDLSRRRAETVKRTLVHFGVSRERLRTQGHGYSRLLDRSETPAAQKINNRIEMVISE